MQTPWVFERTATERGAPRAAGDEASRDPVGALPPPSRPDLRTDRSTSVLRGRLRSKGPCRKWDVSMTCGLVRGPVRRGVLVAGSVAPSVGVGIAAFALSAFLQRRHQIAMRHRIEHRLSTRL